MLMSATTQSVQDTTESRVKSNARNALLGGRAKSHGRGTEEEEITKELGMG